MSKYLRMIDNQLKEYEIVINAKAFTNEKIKYMHALDLYLNGNVKDRIKYKDKIKATVDNKPIYIKFKSNKLTRFYCPCNNGLCEHILSVLIALEREPISFKNIKSINKIMNIYKKLMSDMLNNDLNADKELLYMLHNMILAHNDKFAHHIIGLLLFSTLSNIDKKYNTNTLSIVNNKIGECIESIIKSIDNRKERKVERSWDNIINELLKV